jgi:hypothetical protein
MANYIDILATKDGYFFAAPPWTVREGELVDAPVISGNKLHEVASVATDEVGGAFVKMVEKYIGYPLPKIHAKYHKNEVEWDEGVQE